MTAKKTTDTKKKKLTVKQESIGDLKAGTLACQRHKDKTTVVAAISQCIQPTLDTK